MRRNQEGFFRDLQTDLVQLLRKQSGLESNMRTWQNMVLEFVETEAVKVAKAAAAAQADAAIEESGD